MDQDPELARLYERIGRGQEAYPARVIRDHFRASYVMVGSRFAGHFRYLQNAEPATLKADGFEKVYGDDETIILRVLP